MHGVSTGGQCDVKRIAGKDFPIQLLSAHYTLLHGSKSANQYQSYYVMDYLRHKLNIGITHRIIEKVNAHWQVSWQDRNGTYLHYNADDGSETSTPYESFWQVNLRIYRQTEHSPLLWRGVGGEVRLNIFAEASNLGNKQHHDIGNIILPGRWIRAGIAVTL